MDSAKPCSSARNLKGASLGTGQCDRRREGTAFSFELKACRAEIEAVQRAAFAAVQPGALGGEIYVAAERQLAQISQRDCTDFLAHGMGLVSHEAPRLTATGPVPYDDVDARLPLEPGMVVSIETTMKHPKRGFIKLEDTVVVTPTGHEIFGEGGRGWNLGGSAL
jgi:Xaa-Pro aminopeptidase